MGCDFRWTGHIPDPELQARAIAFLAPVLTEHTLLLPRPELRLPTFLQPRQRQSDVYGRRVSTAAGSVDYPFDFFGLVRWPEKPVIWDRSQFVFDRSQNGNW